jgi:hypothetical protein
MTFKKFIRDKEIPELYKSAETREGREKKVKRDRKEM